MLQAGFGFNLFYSSKGKFKERLYANDSDFLAAVSPFSISVNHLRRKATVYGNNTSMNSFYFNSSAHMTKKNGSTALLFFNEYGFYYDPKHDGFVVPYVDIQGHMAIVKTVFMKFNDNNTFVVAFDASWNVTFWRGVYHEAKYSFIGSGLVGKVTIIKLSRYEFNVTIEFHDYYQEPIPIYGPSTAEKTSASILLYLLASVCFASAGFLVLLVALPSVERDKHKT